MSSRDRTENSPTSSSETSSSDATLLSRMRGGDPAALTELARRHYTTMLSIGGAILGSPENAQDVVQTIFMRLWLQRDELRIVGDVRGYLWRSVQNESRLLLRRDDVRQRYAERNGAGVTLESPAVDNSAPEKLEQEDFARQVRSALAHLPRRCRDIFLLYWGENLTIDEIAQALELNRRTVQNQIAYALRELTKQLRP